MKGYVMSKNKILSDGEWKIMTALWDNPPKTVSQLVNELHDETGWTKGTVFMMLSRLCDKGAVRFEEDRCKQYYPVLERSKAAKTETSNFLSRVYSGSLRLMVSSMADSNELSREDINELYEILHQAEKNAR